MTTKEIVILVRTGVFGELTDSWKRNTERDLSKELRSRERSMGLIGTITVLTALAVNVFWTTDYFARIGQWRHSTMIAGLESTAVTISTVVLSTLLVIWYMSYRRLYSHDFAVDLKQLADVLGVRIKEELVRPHLQTLKEKADTKLTRLAARYSDIVRGKGHNSQEATQLAERIKHNWEILYRFGLAKANLTLICKNPPDAKPAEVVAPTLA